MSSATLPPRSKRPAAPLRAVWPVLALMGCRSAAKPTSDAAPPPALAAAASNRESPLMHDDLWKRALDGDAADLARLADREGAGGLLEGLEQGGALGLTALLSLPFADDAELAYGRLAEILRQVAPSDAAPVVAAVRGVAQSARWQSEPFDPAGLVACGDALLGIARRTELPATVRAPVISAARLLAERHGVDRRAIPVDLDAR